METESFEADLKLLEESSNGTQFKLHLFECGRQVHTDEQLKKFTETVKEVREKVFQLDPAFKEEVEQRQADIMRQRAMERAEVMAKSDQIVAESTKKADKLKRQREREHEDEKLGKWVLEHKIKVRKPEELEKEKLFCPICGDPDYGNSINGVPACVKCNHKLVPRNELKKYNRTYRRNHLRRMKR